MVKQHKGIFCLEGDWWNNLKKPATVEPILELLTKADRYRVPYVHLNVLDRNAFDYSLKKWTQKHFSDHPILYLAFHGNEGELMIGDMRNRSNVVSIKELGDQLKGKCEKRIIFFGSCDVLNVDGRVLNTFLRKTGALAICGYRGDVDWMLGTAFELVVLATLQDNAATKTGVAAMRRKIKARARSLAKDLKFRMVIAASR